MQVNMLRQTIFDFVASIRKLRPNLFSKTAAQISAIFRSSAALGALLGVEHAALHVHPWARD
jgi:hypothetical protein